MITNPILFLAVIAASLVPVQAAPVSTLGTLLFGHHKNNVAHPTTEAGLTSEELHQEWKNSKHQAKVAIDLTKISLGSASDHKTKPHPDDSQVLLNQSLLKQSRDDMKKWKKFYDSQQGRKHDEEGRRKNSAEYRADHLEQWHHQGAVLLPESKVDWNQVRKTIPDRLSELEENHQKAVELKKVYYGTKDTEVEGSSTNHLSTQSRNKGKMAKTSTTL